jgi:hypothetical protein
MLDVELERAGCGKRMSVDSKKVMSGKRCVYMVQVLVAGTVQGLTSNM